MSKEIIFNHDLKFERAKPGEIITSYKWDKEEHFKENPEYDDGVTKKGK